MAHLKASGRRGIARIGAALVWPGLLFLIPALLFLPALYYSLDTPFNLIDDYFAQVRIAFYDNFSAFFGELKRHFTSAGFARFRPFYEFYDGAVWKVAGPTPGLHHLARWGWHFAALFVFAAAFLRFASIKPPDNAAAGAGNGGVVARSVERLAARLPLIFLLYLWFFFPNSPASRLAPQEVYSVFFLGVCTWMAALALTAEPGRLSLRQGLLLYGVFCLGYAGLVFSKESNMGVALWLLLAYLGYARYAGRTGRAAGWKLLLGAGAAAPALLLLLALYGISPGASGNDGSGSPLLDLAALPANAAEIISRLFQTETSLLITAVFALLAAVPLLVIAVQAVKRQGNRETSFVLLLLGQFAAMLLLLSIAWGVSLRYWYILLPVFAMLLAFGVKHLLQWRPAGRPGLRCAAILGLAAFLVFFVAANYYNFLWQTLIQHSSAQTDAQFLARANGLLQAGEYVQIHHTGVSDDLSILLSFYYTHYLPRFKGEEYAIQLRPPDDPARPYYLAALQQHPLPLPVHTAITHGDDYAVLSAARRVAGWLQGGAAYTAKDHGVYYPGEYRWSIYRLPSGLDDYAAGLAGELGEPAAAGGGWQVYLTDNRLLYYNAACGPEDSRATFLLHLTPQDAADFPEGKGEFGFDNRDFRFGPHGVRSEATCLVLKELPEYPISSIRTGQYVDGDNPLWRVEFPATR